MANFCMFPFQTTFHLPTQLKILLTSLGVTWYMMIKRSDFLKKKNNEC